MADLSKLKRRNSLGLPPAVDDASQNLAAPEVAPAAPPLVAKQEPERAVISQDPGPSTRRERIDGRSLHRTGRVLGFSTRVTYEFDETLRRAAQRDGILMIEILERALDMYEERARKQSAEISI
jgi:hypothetical protein